MWARVLQETLPMIHELAPAGSHVLEVGYGDGVLSCCLCQELGWHMVGLDISREAHRTAVEHARRLALTDRIEFRYCLPNETRKHSGQYDAVFIKTVLYSACDLKEYDDWLDWIWSVLKPRGVLINFETGRANALTQCYRRIRRRRYTDLCLYTGEVEALYGVRFDIISRQYYGGWSQFLAPLPSLYNLASRIEEAIRKRDADNSFIVSIIARRLSGNETTI